MAKPEIYLKLVGAETYGSQKVGLVKRNQVICLHDAKLADKLIKKVNRKMDDGTPVYTFVQVKKQDIYGHQEPTLDLSETALVSESEEVRVKSLPQANVVAEIADASTEENETPAPAEGDTKASKPTQRRSKA